MDLFPKAGSSFYSDNDRYILDYMEECYKNSIAINQSFWTEADIDTRFEAGDQKIWRELYGPQPIMNQNLSFNRIKRIANMISGAQRRNRKSTVVVPVENGDEVTADQYSKILSWINNQEGVLETISDSFHGSIVTGLNLMQVYMDYRNDPVSGDIKVSNCSYNSFLMDPWFKKKDLSDCNYLWKRSYITKNECISLLPDKKDLILSFSGATMRDNKFTYLPENFDINRNKNLLIYDEYYYRDYRMQTMLVDSQTGESTEWKINDDDALREYLQAYPQISVLEQEIPTVKLAIVVQGNVLYNGENPLGIDQYPFVPVFAYFNPQLQDFSLRIQGVVRGLRDSQFLYNRMMTTMLDIFESQVNSGFIYKESALVDPRSVFKSGQGRGIALKRDAQMTDIQKITPGQVDQSMFAMSQLLSKEPQEISGVNEELLGSATDEKAGILSMLRQGAGMTTLQTLFDQLDYSQKLLGKLMLDVVQSNFTPGKVKRIIEEEPAPQFYNKAFGKYDAAIEEGVNTTTQRQMQFAQLLNLREVGVPVPDEVILKAATVQNKKELTDALEAANQQKAQVEQMQMQAALEEQKARTQLAQARAAADQGLGMERVSRIEENKELAKERRAEAQKDRTQGLLNLVKTLQEIDNIDLMQLEKLLSLTNLMKAQEMKAEQVGSQQSAPLPSQEELRS